MASATWPSAALHNAVGLVHAGEEGVIAIVEHLDDDQGEDDRAEQRVAACVENKVGGTGFGQLALRRLPSAPDHASGCPKLQPASANQPFGPYRPATQACFWHR